MYPYVSGNWGFGFLWTLRASVFPRAFVIALPNALISYWLSDVLQPNPEPDHEKLAFSLWAGFTSVLGFLLYFRSNVAYSRWWEGGTLLQQVRGEWFNAYSSLIAFCSEDPTKEDAVEEFQHLLGRLMSLLFCSALQQVTPDKNLKSFEIIDCIGIAPQSLLFLKDSADKVEVIIQWIQRSTVINMQTGVLPVPPPVISRVFQELSRGIVNLQNARKIAEFPFPFPYAQTSVVMIMIHWVMCPVICSLLLTKYLAAATAFVVVFFLWCVNFIALQLEMPYGDRENDLPLDQMQHDWNRSLSTLLTKYAQSPPHFDFDREVHLALRVQMSDGLCAPDPMRVSHSTIATLFTEQDWHKDLPHHTSECLSDASHNSHASLNNHEDPKRCPNSAKAPNSRTFSPPPRPSAKQSQSQSQSLGKELQESLGRDLPPVSSASRAPSVQSFNGTSEGGKTSNGVVDLKIPPGGPDCIMPSKLSQLSQGNSNGNSIGSSKGNSMGNSIDRISQGGALERRMGRSTSAPTHAGSVTDHPPPWTLDAASSRRSGLPQAMQCSAGCLQAFVKLKPAGAPVGKSFSP